MARFHVLSDLHEEFAPFDPVPLEGIDGVLLAGDAAAPGLLALTCAALWLAHRVPVIAIEGNHDLWRIDSAQAAWMREMGMDMPEEGLAGLRSIQAFNDQMVTRFAHDHGTDITILRRGQSRVLGDTRVIGATLWTDYSAGAPSREWGMRHASGTIKDFQFMDMDEAGQSRPVQPEDLLALHHRDAAAILEALDQPFDGPTVVMTHHVPDPRLLDRNRYPEGPDDGAFAATLWPRIRERAVDAWIFGHSHHGIETALRGERGWTTFVTNPRGLPGEGTAFDPARILDSGDPRIARDRGDPEAALDSP